MLILKYNLTNKCFRLIWWVNLIIQCYGELRFLDLLYDEDFTIKVFTLDFNVNCVILVISNQREAIVPVWS